MLDRFGRRLAIWASSVSILVFGVITSFVPWFPVFVSSWWVTGTMTIVCYTAALDWIMKIATKTRKWKMENISRNVDELLMAYLSPHYCR